MSGPSEPVLRALLEVILEQEEALPSGSLGELIERVVSAEVPFLSEAQRAMLVKRLVANAVGYGPLDELLADPEVDEVMVNGPDEVWVERRGKLERSNVSFDSAEALREAADRLLASAGRRVDDLAPLADARLPDGSRVNVALPPLAVDGPALTIRRFRPEGFGLDDLVAAGTLDRRLADLLRAAVVRGRNVLVSGATGSGKTTTLAALARAIPHDQRVVTIEDAAELSLEHPHVVRLEARPQAPGGGGAIAIRDLLRNALRMRPDRIVVGEVRGGEAFDMLDAMATGHSGSLSTIHAGTPQGALVRLAGLAHQSGISTADEAIDQRIRATIDLVVQQRRLSDGSRVVEAAAVVVGADGAPRALNFFELTGGRPVWRAVDDEGILSGLSLQ